MEEESKQERDPRSPNLMERAKEEIQAAVSHREEGKKSRCCRHHKETHGAGGGIDESTPIDCVKAPNLFERAKEELEALSESLFSKDK